jgi:hypothetical protein
LAAEVVLLADHVVADTLSVGVLEVSVEVDLADTVGDGLLELLDGRAGTTVEDEEDGLVILGASLLLDVLLVLGEEAGLELDVTGLVNTVDVTEASGDGEVGRDLGEGLVDLVDVLGLGVEGVVVNVLVVDTVLLTTGDTDLHLEPLLHGGSTLEVLLGGLDVVVNLILRQINHVGRETGELLDGARRSALSNQTYRGVPFFLKKASSASIMPSSHGRSFLAQWSVWRTTGIP